MSTRALTAPSTNPASAAVKFLTDSLIDALNRQRCMTQHTAENVADEVLLRLEGVMEIRESCLACGSFEIDHVHAEYPTGNSGECWNEYGYRCRRCGAFENECVPLLAMQPPAAATGKVVQ